MIIKVDALIAAFRRLHNEQALRDQGKIVRYYFDTHDIVKIILGAHAYYEKKVFQSSVFDGNDALLWALAALGHVSSIRLLAPHQAELLTLVQYDFHRDDTISDDERLATFSHDARPPRGAAFNGRVVVATKMLAASWLPWKSRLTKLVGKKTLDLETARHDYTRIVETKIFHDLYDRFNSHRSGRTVNNFADAAALASLLTAVEEFRKGESNEAPVFYASSTLFADVLREVGERDSLILKVTNDETLDVLCSSEDLIVKALLADAPEKEQENALNEMIMTLSEDPNPLSIDRQALALAGNYADTLNEMIGLRLHQQVWLPAFQQLKSERNSKAFADLATKESQEYVEEQLVDLFNRLRRNTITFRRLRSLWIEVSQSVDTFMHRKLPENPLFIDGLLRFSFPRKFIPGITARLRELRSGDRYKIDSVAAFVFRILDQSSDNDDEDIPVAAALLWVLRLDQRLLALTVARPRNTGGRHSMHHSIAMLRAAAQFRSGYSPESIKPIIDQLNEQWHTASPMTRAEIGIGIAYLDFRLAKANGFVPSWQGEDGKAGTNDVASAFIGEAIARSRAAASYDKLDQGRCAYATNQHLYYLVAENTAADIMLQQAAVRLTRFQYTDGVWQPRFDDTLARYFQLRAHREKNPKTKRQLLGWALDLSQSALAADPDDDKDIRAFSKEIKIEYDGNRQLESDGERSDGERSPVSAI